MSATVLEFRRPKAESKDIIDTDGFDNDKVEVACDLVVEALEGIKDNETYRELLAFALARIVCVATSYAPDGELDRDPLDLLVDGVAAWLGDAARGDWP